MKEVDGTDEVKITARTLNMLGGRIVPAQKPSKFPVKNQMQQEPRPPGRHGRCSGARGLAHPATGRHHGTPALGQALWHEGLQG